MVVILNIYFYIQEIRQSFYLLEVALSRGEKIKRGARTLIETDLFSFLLFFFSDLSAKKTDAKFWKIKTVCLIQGDISCQEEALEMKLASFESTRFGRGRTDERNRSWF